MDMNSLSTAKLDGDVRPGRGRTDGRMRESRLRVSCRHEIPETHKSPTYASECVTVGRRCKYMTIQHT